jgi:hypothetical protein
VSAFTIGHRKVGGRKKGTPNNRTQQIVEAAHREGVTPLEYMLRIVRDEDADPARRDDMAKAAAPYVHPRLASVKAKIDVSGHEAMLIELDAIEIKPGELALPSPRGSTNGAV